MANDRARLMPRSLRGRMLALSVIAAALALGLAGWSMAGLLGRFVTRNLDRQLDAELAVMASALREDATVDEPRLRARLGLLNGGPAWQWQIAGPRGTVGSANFPRLDRHGPGPGPRPGPGPGLPPPPPTLPPPPPPTPDADPDDDAAAPPAPADGRSVAGEVHARRITIRTAAGLVTLSAAAPTAVISSPIRGALIPLLSTIAALAAIFAATIYLQLKLGLRPLLRMRDQVVEIRAGRRGRVDEDQPAELLPLATELNALASDYESARQGARRSAANLAHALKTPVATLALAVGRDPVARAQITRIEGLIGHHLSRARAVSIGRRSTALVGPVLADLSQAMASLHPAIALDIAVTPDAQVLVDAPDLTEILGNLIDNAARHAAGRVQVTTRRQQARFEIAVEDDGPGIPRELRERATSPGVRLDESAGGDGFGLAIVRELVLLYNGTLTLGESPLGGLAATVALPIA